MRGIHTLGAESESAINDRPFPPRAAVFAAMVLALLSPGCATHAPRTAVVPFCTDEPVTVLLLTGSRVSGAGNGIAVDGRHIVTVDHLFPEDGITDHVWMLFPESVPLHCEHHNVRLPAYVDRSLRGVKCDIVRLTRASDEFVPGDWPSIWQSAETLPVLRFDCLQNVDNSCRIRHFGPVAERQTQRTQKYRDSWSFRSAS